MKLVIVTVAVALLFCLFGTRVQAEELDLNDCIELALKNRASIVRAHGAEKLAAAGKRSALGALIFPNISGSYSWSKGKETNIEPASAVATGYTTVLDTTDIGGQIAIDAMQVPTGLAFTDEQDIGPRKSWYISGGLSLSLSNWFDYAAARADHASAKLDVIASEQDLIYSVKIAYYAYLATVENVSVQEEAAKRAEEQLKLIESKYELGSAALSDVLKQKVQHGNDRLALLRAGNGVTNQVANLAYTIGLDPRLDHTFSTAYEVRAYEGPLTDAVEFGLSHNPSLLSQERSFAATGSSVNSAWMSYLPSLSLYADYNKFNGTQAYPVAFDYSSNSYTYGFRVNMNVFDGFFRERNVAWAKVNRNNARADLADMRNLTTSKVKVAYLDIAALKEQKSVSTENVDAAEEDLKITQEKYKLGAATILDLLESQVSLKTAQVSLIQVDFDLNLAIAQLENAMGKM
jgi:outer membrane protein TolC